MPLPTIETISNFWNTGPRYRPGGGTYSPAPIPPAPIYQIPAVAPIAPSPQPVVPPVQQPIYQPPAPTTQPTYQNPVQAPVTQSPVSQIPQDPFAYFGGTSPYGNYAKQVAQGYNPSQLPRLKIPSLQTWARMGPQFQQQYYGYKQAQTGAIPEQSYWNIMRLAPPSGQGTQLGYRR